MGTFTASVETAFKVTEVMQYARVLDGDMTDSESESEALWEIVHFWALLGNTVWVPRLMDIQRQQRLEQLVAATPLKLYRNQLLPREESVSAVTPGVTNGLRDRVRDSIYKVVANSNGQYSSVTDKGLWKELEGEAAVDFTFRSVRPNFELRGCAFCGRWYEPLLSNRGRFCGIDCRKRFNNLKHSKKDDQRTFQCAWDGQTHSMELFSGLVHQAEDDLVTPLRIGRYSSYSDNLWCIDCVERERPEWTRYIAPLIEAREERDRESDLSQRDLEDALLKGER